MDESAIRRVPCARGSRHRLPSARHGRRSVAAGTSTPRTACSSPPNTPRSSRAWHGARRRRGTLGASACETGRATLLFGSGRGTLDLEDVRAFERGQTRRLPESVEASLPVRAHRDEARFVEDAQVPRDAGLVHAGWEMWFPVRRRGGCWAGRRARVGSPIYVFQTLLLLSSHSISFSKYLIQSKHGFHLIRSELGRRRRRLRCRS
jgi:hypothetical protein